MNQLPATPEVQRPGKREKRPDLAKLHFAPLFVHLITDNETNDDSDQMRGYPTGCGKPEFDATKRRTKENEIQFLTEASVTP
jgi:hypothetical protein